MEIEEFHLVVEFSVKTAIKIDQDMNRIIGTTSDEEISEVM